MKISLKDIDAALKKHSLSVGRLTARPFINGNRVSFQISMNPYLMVNGAPISTNDGHTGNVTFGYEELKTLKSWLESLELE